MDRALGERHFNAVSLERVPDVGQDLAFHLGRSGVLVDPVFQAVPDAGILKSNGERLRAGFGQDPGNRLGCFYKDALHVYWCGVISRIH